MGSTAGREAWRGGSFLVQPVFSGQDYNPGPPSLTWLLSLTLEERKKEQLKKMSEEGMGSVGLQTGDHIEKR